MSEPFVLDLSNKTPFFQRRLTTNILIIVAAIILVASFFMPYWEMHMMAPQYPEGLHVYTYLNEVKGDTAEINQLNHYIGMGNIENAAEFERSIAWVAILSLAIGGVLVGAIGFKIRQIFYLPPVLFILGFLADFTIRMYDFGHNLNPDAAITLEPFMPTILGTGKIGQFTTTAYFSTGFWMAVVSCAIFLFALINRRAKCLGCENRFKCKVLCDNKRYTK